jgi:ABC-type lipoprotein export system ATPase subunit
MVEVNLVRNRAASREPSRLSGGSKGWSSSEISARVHAKLALERPGKMTGVRVSLQLASTTARAILKNAPIVLLDEATAALDPENEALIQRGFQALVCAKTLVEFAHRLLTIRHVDQILVIDQGRIVERGYA